MNNRNHMKMRKFVKLTIVNFLQVDIGGAAHSIFDLKYSIPKKILLKKRVSRRI